MSQAITKQFAFQGTSVFFSTDGSHVMVNATMMARKFGKRVHDWLRNNGTQQFLHQLTEARKCVSPHYQAIRIIKGGNDIQGTWLSEDAALEFARWVNPEFAVWCNDRIKELLRTGITTTMNVDDMLADPDVAIRMLQALKEERSRAKALEAQTIQQQQIIEESRPKVNFANSVENSDTLILVRDLAKILKQHGFDTGEQRLFQTLRNDGYLTLRNVPTQRSMELGIMRVVENTITTPDGDFTRLTPKITGRGQLYFVNHYCPTLAL